MLRQAQHKRVWAIGLTLIATPLVAQETKPPTPYDRAIAAGYKALTLCSAIWNAGRTQAQVEALELTGIYPEYDALLPTLTATVQPDVATVSVPFAADMEPRRAQWRVGGGCTILPIGAAAPLIPRYRQNPLPVPPGDRRHWPVGDVGGFASPRPALDAATKAGFGDGYGKGTRTVAALVLTDGNIAAEHYADGFGPFVANRTWSVAKSLSGTLIGHYALAGKIDPAKPARIREWGSQRTRDPRTAITIDNLLRMASGLNSDTAGNRTDALYFGGSAVDETATAAPLIAKPGSTFRYANNDILLAVRALRTALGDPDYDSAPRDLFARIGMTHTVAETDWRGNFVLSSQVWSTARDLARFGMLYLNDGMWQGQRILPEGWVKYVTTPSGPQPDGDFGYGATFWLMNKSPGVPADTFAAFGNRGQYVVIVPSRKVVIVRRGEDPAGARFDIAKFTADVLSTLKDRP